MSATFEDADYDYEPPGASAGAAEDSDYTYVPPSGARPNLTPKPLYAGKAVGEEPKGSNPLKVAAETYGNAPPATVEGALPAEMAPQTFEDPEYEYQPPGQVAAQAGPPPGIANKPALAAVWQAQQQENAGIPSSDTAALIGALPGATRVWPSKPTPPLQAPAVPGKPLTPTGQPIQMTGPETEPTPISQGVGLLNRAYEQATAPVMGLAGESAKAYGEIVGKSLEPFVPDDEGSRNLMRGILGLSSPAGVPAQFAHAIGSPEMAPFMLAPELAGLRGPAVAAKVGAAVSAYFGAQGV